MADIYNGPSTAGSPGTEPVGPPEQTFVEIDARADAKGAGSLRAVSDSMPEWQKAISQWLSENQVLAMAGGFAIGVFLGVLLRD